MKADLAKINAAAAALSFVEDGMDIGLGTGSTAAHFVRLLGQRAVSEGLKLRCVATSEATRAIAELEGLSVVDPNQVSRLHLTVDGADEVDAEFRIIKGGGAALLREKIVACASDHLVIIADQTKLVAQLGVFPLPVEVVPFGFMLTAQRIFEAVKAQGCRGHVVRLRTRADEETPVITDGGNYILDCRCERIPDPEGLAAALDRIVGVVEHGLFIDLARTVIFGSETGADVRER